MTALLDCLLDEVSNHQVLARELQTRIRSVTALKKRLKRRLAEFKAIKSSVHPQVPLKNA